LYYVIVITIKTFPFLLDKNKNKSRYFTKMGILLETILVQHYQNDFLTD